MHFWFCCLNVQKPHSTANNVTSGRCTANQGHRLVSLYDPRKLRDDVKTQIKRLVIPLHKSQGIFKEAAHVREILSTFSIEHRRGQDSHRATSASFDTNFCVTAGNAHSTIWPACGTDIKWYQTKDEYQFYSFHSLQLASFQQFVCVSDFQRFFVTLKRG